MVHAGLHEPKGAAHVLLVHGDVGTLGQPAASNTVHGAVGGGSDPCMLRSTNW